MFVNFTAVGDTTFPEITISNPTNNSNQSTTAFTLNYTYIETNPGFCWYSNNSGTANSTTVAMGTNWSLSGVEGSNNRTVYCNDTANNLNSTIVYFTIDTTYPEINITYPINNTDYSDINLDVNYTYVEVNCDSVWYSNDSYATNTTLGCGTNITAVTWTIGTHNVTIWINDSVNQINYSYVNFSISAGPPTNVWSCSSNQNFDNASCWTKASVPVAGEDVFFNGTGPAFAANPNPRPNKVLPLAIVMFPSKLLHT